MPASTAVTLLPSTTPGAPATTITGRLSHHPSPLRPSCPAAERIFRWRSATQAPATTLPVALLRHLEDLASRASLADSTLSSYGSAVRKFTIFADIFSIPEADRMPASFAIIKSFVLWAATDPDPSDPVLADGTPFEPVATRTARSYLAGIRAWHLAQGFAPPLSDEQHDMIDFTLRGLDRLQGSRRRRPPRPPITLPMLLALKSSLRLSDSFDACLWAAVTCAFWGMMRFGEITVHSQAAFSGSRHLKRSDVLVATDLRGTLYARLDLPHAKTAKPGEIQQVFVVQQGTLCPIAALRNLSQVVPAAATHPLFSWRDRYGNVRPLVRDAALERINGILNGMGYGTTYGHSFRIGGASFYLAQKVDPEVVRLAGRWRSLAYEAYIRAFEQVSSRHMGGLEQAALAEHQPVAAS